MASVNHFNQTVLRGDKRLALESFLPHQSSASGDWEKHSVRFLLNNPSSIPEGLYCNRAALQLLRVTAKWYLLN